MITENSIIELNVRFRLSHIRFSIFPVTGHQLVDRQVDRRQTALHRTSYSADRVNVPLVVTAVAVGGGEETLDCGQRHHFKGPPKLTVYS